MQSFIPDIELHCDKQAPFSSSLVSGFSPDTDHTPKCTTTPQHITALNWEGKNTHANCMKARVKRGKSSTLEQISE